ncbi:hypothetical protein NA57DRAFT_59897 [Rhizodiscina lignyota]|uniref:Uncharacterized protein n=1 Tax=Rhizodiscina lignyota TaxID=1504668 RepID=A0A9P4I938_9PEZI|nr:hypothetical protein NA57DRAFT_59897 [Rhizodiscina lignyota]
MALTTIFTPPSSCFNYDYTWSTAASTYGNGQSSILVKDVNIQSTECYPPNYHAQFTVATPYSPGVCPWGYVSAATRTTSINPGATGVLCCPGAWQTLDGGLGCSTALSDPMVLQLPDGPMVASSGQLVAMHGIYIEYASSDLKVLPATTTSSSTTTSTTSSSRLPHTTMSTVSSKSTVSSQTPRPAKTVSATVTPSTSSTSASGSASSTSSTSTSASSTSASSTSALSTSASTSSTSSSASASASPTASTHESLSTGAQAGIGVGVSLAGLALIASAIWAVFRWRRRPQLVEPENQGMIQYYNGPAVPAGTHNRNIFTATDSRLLASELDGSQQTSSGGLELR